MIQGATVTKLNISQASRAIHKPRTTVQRHIDKGKLSSEKDATGKTVIDVSELQRVYGNLDMDAAFNKMKQIASKMQNDTDENNAEVQHLKLELKHFEEKFRTSEERRQEAEAREQKLLEIIEKQTLMLAAPQEVVTPVKKSFWQRLFSS